MHDLRSKYLFRPETPPHYIFLFSILEVQSMILIFMSKLSNMDKGTAWHDFGLTSCLGVLSSLSEQTVQQTTCRLDLQHRIVGSFRKDSTNSARFQNVH